MRYTRPGCPCCCSRAPLQSLSLPCTKPRYTRWGGEENADPHTLCSEDGPEGIERKQDHCSASRPLTILQAHGIQYEEVDDFPDTVDAMIIERGRETYAAVNGRQHLHRRRFSLAHELGHFFLHRGDYGSEAMVTIDDPPSEEDLVPTKDPAESEADMFAGELLVPLAMLKPLARKGIAELSRIFLVSEHVISVAISKHYNLLFK